MSVGLSPTQNDISATIGDIARGYFYQFRRAEQFKYFLDGQTDAQLIALGFAQADVNLLRSAASDLDTVRQIFEGLVGHVQGDMRAFIRQVDGMGDV